MKIRTKNKKQEITKKKDVSKKALFVEGAIVPLMVLIFIILSLM